MDDDDFEWDRKKAARNETNHGIGFEVAREVFDDPYSIERADSREDYGEDRYNITGMIKGQLITVTYTIRGGGIWVISARGAEPYEAR
jgi:uncharacterized DUF497 family protein